MTNEPVVFGLMTVVLGSVMLLADVAVRGQLFAGIGGAIMVAGILAMAAYVSLLAEPEGEEAEAGH